LRYTREDGCRAWLTYGQIRCTILNHILDEFGSAEAVYDRFMRDGGSFLKKRHVTDTALSKLAEHASPDAMHQMMLIMKRQAIGIMGMHDDLYPVALRDIPMPPALLFYRGAPECLIGKCLTIIGSRTASPQSLEATRNISRELSNAGVTVVSGMAMGIDAAAHEGCLQGSSPSAAILACGMNVDYPIENIEIREQIVREGGVLLSEYPLDMRSSKTVFAGRNRLLSGVSRAVLMMESRIRSGSMLTVNHALEQGKDVYAYPGIPGTEWAEGAHQLLREGALFFTSAKDILEDLGWEAAKPLPPEQKKSLPPMNEDQRAIYTLLSRGEMSFDQLVAESGLSVPTVSVSLTMLQMMGLVKAMPGKSYCRI